MNLVVVLAIKFLIRTMNQNDIYYMQLALKEAEKAWKINEVPVGCILVSNGKVISKAYNKREKNHSVISHAEIEAIKKANKKLATWILDDVTLYVTLEPCLMCAGAILQSRIKRVVYATKEPKFGAMGSIINLADSSLKFNHKIEVTSGILEEESSLMLKNFFRELRIKNKVKE